MPGMHNEIGRRLVFVHVTGFMRLTREHYDRIETGLRRIRQYLRDRLNDRLVKAGVVRGRQPILADVATEVWAEHEQIMPMVERIIRVESGRAVRRVIR